jgi:hypothetical protein
MNSLAEAFESPKDSPEHRRLREDSWLVGPEMECRYYLGMLSGRNEFRRSRDEFLDDLADFVASRTSAQAVMFCCTEHHCQFVVGFLRRLFERQEGCMPGRKETREQRAMEVLLKHPNWSDEQIVAEVGATVKSVKRWPVFRYARRCQGLYEQRAEGWYYPRPTRASC